MRKYLLTSITIAVSISLITASVEGEDCKPDVSGEFLICERSGELIAVIRRGNSSRLALDLTNISKISPSLFETGINIDTLVLSRFPNTSCTLKSIHIPSGSFYALSNEVHNLELNCLFSPAILDSFKNLKSLMNLTLKAVHFRVFPNSYFAYFPSLIELKLEELNVSEIYTDSFNYTNKGLQHLIMIDKISKIEPESFARFSSLKRLVLNGGQLLEVWESRVFSGLDNLKHLDLDNNGITGLHPYIFRPLSQLENLYLRRNKIKRIFTLTFHGLKNLRKLDLAHNNLIYIDEGLFDDLQKLEYLNISSNRLSCIGPEEFGRNSSLRTLDLSNNRITCLESNSFYGLHLKTLTLMNNYLTQLDSQVFANLHVEKLLDLRGSNITYLDRSIFQNLIPEQVSFCYQGDEHVTEEDISSWGIVGNSIKNFTHNDCWK